MSITTYAELQTALTGRMKRSDFSATEAIALTEAEMNRVLEDPAMEVEVTAAASEYLAVPSDYLILRRIQVNTSPPRQLDLYSPAWAAPLSTSGIPKFYSLEDRDIRLIPPPDGSYTIEMTYYQTIPALSNTNTTNWLLTRHPDIYLMGGLYWGCVELRDADGASLYKELYDQAVESLRRFGRRQKWAGNPMAMRRG